MMLFGYVHLEAFLDQFRTLEDSAARLKGPGADRWISPQEKEPLAHQVKMFSQFLEPNGLTTTAVLVSDLVSRFEKCAFTFEGFLEEVSRIQATFKAELRSHRFLYLDQRKAAYLYKENGFGQEVANAFPSISYDLMESCTCYALSRSTASVFHLMRVLEVLIKCIESALGMKDHPSWGSFLTEMAKANLLRHTPKTSEDFLFFASLESQLWAIKNAWRDDTMHSIACKYTEEEAQMIFRAVEGLMRKAAIRLRESAA